MAGANKNIEYDVSGGKDNCPPGIDEEIAGEIIDDFMPSNCQLKEIGRAWIDGVEYVALNDGVYNLVVAAEDYDSYGDDYDYDADNGAAYAEWCRGACHQPDDIILAVARRVGLNVVGDNTGEIMDVDED